MTNIYKHIGLFTQMEQRAVGWAETHYETLVFLYIIPLLDNVIINMSIAARVNVFNYIVPLLIDASDVQDKKKTTASF